MKIFFKVLILSSVLSNFTNSAHAARESGESLADDPARSEFHFLLEPVIGYQFLKRSYPYSHNVGMLVYGGRAVVGSQIFAGELSYSYGSTSETFSSPNVTVESSASMLRLGGRTIYPLASWISVIGRGGEQMSTSKITYTFSGTAPASPTSGSVTEWTPYIGTGFWFHFIPQILFDVEGTYLFSGSFETAVGFRLYI